MTTQNRGDYTALGDRMLLLTALRVGMAAVVVTWSLVRPELLGVPMAALIAGCAAYVALAVVAEGVRRELAHRGYIVIGLMLLVDGVALASAMYVTGGTQSPIRFLDLPPPRRRLVAVPRTGPASRSRSGTRCCCSSSSTPRPPSSSRRSTSFPAAAIEFDRMPVLNVTSFWLFALATSVFSAMNERELRQRRADLETLVDIGAQARRRDATRSAVADRPRRPGRAVRVRAWRGPRCVEGQDGRPCRRAASTTLPTTPSDADAIVDRSLGPQAIRCRFERLDPQRNPFLTSVLPGARNLLVSPLRRRRPGTVGAVVIEYRPRPVLLGVERRVA